ncbi:MAG: hypothetical protein ACSHWN_04645 [Methylophilaceae bacterium]
MINTYIATRLQQWADWSARRLDSGLGYPKQVPYTNLMPRSGKCAGSPEFDEECYEIDRCVVAVLATNPQLHKVIILCYRRQAMTVEQKLKELGCSKQTYYNKIELANNMVLGFLNDLHTGVALASPLKEGVA